MFFSNLQSLLNLLLKFGVTHYSKSVIRTIIIEYNKSFVKKPTFNKKPGFFTEKTQPSGLNGYIPGYIPRPTLVVSGPLIAASVSGRKIPLYSLSVDIGSTYHSTRLKALQTFHESHSRFD